jgi:hypothetical protein
MSMLDRARGAVFKPVHIDHVVLDGKSGRLVTANAGGPLLTCLPPVTGYSPPVSGSCPATMAVVHDGSIGVDFAAIPVASAPPLRPPLPAPLAPSPPPSPSPAAAPA